jgi:hypothetical protein
MFALEAFSHARDQSKPEGFLKGLSTRGPLGKDLDAFAACYARLRDCIFHYLDTTDDFK